MNLERITTLLNKNINRPLLNKEFRGSISKRSIFHLFIMLLTTCSVILMNDLYSANINNKGFLESTAKEYKFGKGVFEFSKKFTDKSKNIDPDLKHKQSLEIFQHVLRYSKLSPVIAFELASAINQECEKYDIDPLLVLAMIQIESQFSPKAISHMGAVGLMQVQPQTGKYVAKKYGINYKGFNSLIDPVTNIKLGISYLSFLESLYGDIEHALFAYNFGPNKIKGLMKSFENGSKPYYVRQVLDFKNVLESEKDDVDEIG